MAEGIEAGETPTEQHARRPRATKKGDLAPIETTECSVGNITKIQGLQEGILQRSLAGLFPGGVLFAISRISKVLAGLARLRRIRQDVPRALNDYGGVNVPIFTPRILTKSQLRLARSELIFFLIGGRARNSARRHISIQLNAAGCDS